MEFRKALSELPIVYVHKPSLKIIRNQNGKIINYPWFPMWCRCKYYTWDNSKKIKDFVSKESIFWFDGENFHQTQDLFNVDAADWIYEVVQLAPLV